MAEETTTEIRPLTREEIEECGFSFADPTWEIAYQLKELGRDIHPLRWQVYMLAEALPKLTRELNESLKTLGQTIERATAPWYVRMFWTWRRRRQNREMTALQKAHDKEEQERRDKLAELMKTRRVNSRFHSRF